MLREIKVVRSLDLAKNITHHFFFGYDSLLMESLYVFKKSTIRQFSILIFTIVSFTAHADEDSRPSSEVKAEAKDASDSFQQALEKPLLEKITSPNIKTYLDRLDTVKKSVGRYVQSSGEEIDRFFGSNDLDVTYKQNHLTVYTPVTFYKGGEIVSELNFNLQIDLPRTNNRWKVFLSSFDEPEEDNLSHLDQNRNEGLNNNSNTRLGGRYLINDTKNRITQTDVGIKFINFIEPNPFIEFEDRFKNELYAGIQSRTTNTLLLERDEGLAWQGEQVFDKKISQKSLVRSQTRLSWWGKDSMKHLKQSFIYFYQLSPYRANAYYIDANWLADNLPQRFDNVAVGMNWREQLYKSWLFAEIETQAIYYKYATGLSKPSYRLKLLLEMHF